jgi:hypothetical protein
LHTNVPNRFCHIHRIWQRSCCNWRDNCNTIADAWHFVGLWFGHVEQVHFVVRRMWRTIARLGQFLNNPVDIGIR